MSRPYLEVTYRQGKPFAAYLYLARLPGDHAARTQRYDFCIVDFAEDGRAIGVEFTRVEQVDLAALNRILTSVHHSTVSVSDLAPLRAA